jgi:hypothetical protein
MATPGSKREWRLDELRGLFPGLAGDVPRAASRPDQSTVGFGTYIVAEEGERHGASVELRLVPSGSFLLSLGHRWPFTLSAERRECLDLEILRGLFKAAMHCSPPALGCAVTTSFVEYRADTTEKAVHVAAYKAFKDASEKCSWTTPRGRFPKVRIERDDDLEHAWAKSLMAFEQAGFSVSDALPLNRKLSAAELVRTRIFSIWSGVTRNFSIVSGSRIHVFLVCSEPWTRERAAEIARVVHDISYDEGHDGLVAEFQFLSAHPVPDELLR